MKIKEAELLSELKNICTGLSEIKGEIYNYPTANFLAEHIDDVFVSQHSEIQREVIEQSLLLSSKNLISSFVSCSFIKEKNVSFANLPNLDRLAEIIYCLTSEEIFSNTTEDILLELMDYIDEIKKSPEINKSVAYALLQALFITVVAETKYLMCFLAEYVIKQISYGIPKEGNK